MHAAGESASGHSIPKNTVAVALAARDQQHLLELDTKLTVAGIDHILICECDGELMAIGCAPTRDRKKVRKVLSSLPLVK